MNRKFIICVIAITFITFINANPVVAKVEKLRGNVESIATDYLTVDGKRVEFDKKTKFFRKFGGKSDRSEISVGDDVQVVGTASAKLIRNFSVQKRHAVFIGTIKSLNPKTATLVLTTSHRGDQNVMPTKDTKYVTRKMEVSSFDKLGVSDKIRVKGTWDSKLNQIFEVTQIKDYSL